MAKVKRYVVVDVAGIACPRCGRPTQVREHSEVTSRHKNQPFYYRRWFNCTAEDCQTTLIMRDEFKVWNSNPRGEEMRRVSDIQQQLRPRA